MLERGDFVPQETENWDPAAVWKHLRYRTTERWLDERGRDFLPYTHYCVGGNTKFWGSVLYRLRREDFGELEHLDGVSPAWPIDYDTLAPYYDRAERLYHGARRGTASIRPTRRAGRFRIPPIPHAPRMAAIVERLRGEGLHPSPLPLGLLRPGEAGGCVLCNTCNSFPCQHAREERRGRLLRAPGARAPERDALDRDARPVACSTDPAGTRVEAVELERGGQMEQVACRRWSSCRAAR